VVNRDIVPDVAIADLTFVTGANPLCGLNTLCSALAFRTKSGLMNSAGEAEFPLSSQGGRRADLAYRCRVERAGMPYSPGPRSTMAAGAHSAGRPGNVLLKIVCDAGPTAWSASLLTARSRVLGNGLLPDLLYEKDRRTVYIYPDTTRKRLLQGGLNITQPPRERPMFRHSSCSP
jgi:hypothetical protein